MPSRREFIQRGLAVSALAACPLAGRAALASSFGGSHRFFRVLFDTTFAEGAAFGAEAANRDAPVHAIGSDVSNVWMNEIQPRWKRGPIAIAGLTGGAPLFCLELLGRDYGMGVVYRAEHVPAGDGRVRHVVTGPDPLPEWENRLTAAGNQWSAVAAAMATSCPDDLQPEAKIDLLDLAKRPGAGERSLFSWVIAPARWARVYYAPGQKRG